MNFELSARSYILALLLAFGVSVELIKLWPSASGVATHTVSEIEDHLFGSKPYAMSDKSLHKTIAAKKSTLNTQALAVPNFDMKGAVEKFGKEQEKVLQDAKKNDEAAKDWHWVWNKKLGQWLWKKKTPKKEGKDDEATAVVQMPVIPVVPTASANSDSANNGGSAIGAVNTPAVSGFTPFNTATSTFLTQAEWEALLLKTPNTAETTKFAKQYLQHMVTESVFYAIVNEMLKASNVEMQQQGVLALNLTPSVESFVALVKESQTAQSSSPVSSAVTTALNTYAQTKNLSNLQTVLKTQKDNTVLTAALTQLQNSIKTNLNGTGSNPTTQGGNNASLYQAFVPILNGLMTNNAVASQARSILSSIGGTNSSVAQF